jgi:DNA-binding transcriptional ArsR family regulator
MRDVQVIDEPAVAAAVLDPLRSRLLAALATPGSATSLAAALGMPRQKVNYHLRTLEHLGLVRQVESRPRRGLTERVVRSSAHSYVLSPAVLGANAPEPARVDRLSAAYLVAVAARLVREVGELAGRAEASGRSLPTLTLDTELRFASAADRAAFTAELAEAVTRLVGRYHVAGSAEGRTHRLVVAAHPLPRPLPSPLPTPLPPLPATPTAPAPTEEIPR